MTQRQVIISNRRGLHARASAKLVRLVETFDARVKVEINGESVAATSIMGLMMLGAAQGARLVLHAEGPEREAALAAVCALVESKFDEE